jgi:hypothetical protein
MRFDNVWRLGTAQALSVASVGGAAASSAAFRHSDLCDSAGLSWFDFFDGRLQDCNRESERQCRQLYARHATATELGAAIPRAPAVRTLSVSTEGYQTGPTAAALPFLSV